MKIGLYDVDGHNFPNLSLMKLSAYHKALGDTVELYFPMSHYDKVYVSKVFGEEYSEMQPYAINADEVEYGGTGFAISIENGKEVYHKDRDQDLPYEIEHIYPDYELYPELTKSTAFGFLTRGCCNSCDFCIVSEKEGCCSKKVADLSEFWRGQKHIKLLDPNILACRERCDLLRQLAESKAKIDFTQGLDARFITREVAELLNKIDKATVHFAFDFMKNEKAIIAGLTTYKEVCGVSVSSNTKGVYMLTNYNTTHEEDLRRIELIKGCGFVPYVMIYRKPTAPRITRYLQRWCNNRLLYNSCNFGEYKPHSDGKTIKEIFGGNYGKV